MDRSHSNKNNTLENKLRNGPFKKDNINIKNLNNNSDEGEPNENFNPEEFKTIRQIGEGSFGKIYCSEWKKNNKYYAMKKMILKKKEEIKKNNDQTNLVYNFLKKTHNKGIIKIYGSQCNTINDKEYNFYVLMELAEIDWEKEIKKRKQLKNYYTEGELYEITRQLIKTFSLLQKNNITHRDIKPQNILIVNNVYKICDFGEAKVTEGNSVIRQTIKGTELYMSPILFSALNKRQNYIIHNTYKSDVFSLGMCLFLAATLTFRSLYEIRELKDMNMIKNILEKYLIVKYSYNFVNILFKMLEINENLRPDFIELDKDLYQK
jgi:serine/threonine protein kinase